MDPKGVHYTDLMLKWYYKTVQTIFREAILHGLYPYIPYPVTLLRGVVLFLLLMSFVKPFLCTTDACSNETR